MEPARAAPAAAGAPRTGGGPGPLGRRAAEVLRHPLGALVRGLVPVWTAIVVAAVTLSLFRVAFLLRHGGATYPTRSLARAFLIGVRFDLKTAAILFLPLVVLGALAPMRPRLRTVAFAWAVLAFAALDLTAMVNDGYYGFFHTPIDAIVFGLFDDDTRAVLRSVWEDHPVVLAVLATAALATAQAAVALRGWAPRPAPVAPSAPGAPAGSLAARTAAVVILGFGLFLVARGRLGTFPLNEQDLAVAPEPFVNAMTPNGAYGLYVAWKQRKSISIGTDARAGLRRAGFGTPAEAAAALGLAPATASDDAVAEALYEVTPENPVAAASPPHVVVAVMEAWGTDLLAYHAPGNDLLGRLAPHLERGLLFRRFLSGDNGTHPTLEALLLGTPITPLTYSALGRRRWEQSAALPFRTAGYRTVFVTGGSGAWRGLDRTLPFQGFDEVHDQADVLAAVPGARAGTWGVFDHELFAFAAARLREADRKGERLLLVLLTMTNHPPHAVPPEYRVRPLDPGAFEGRALGDPTLRRPILETYQYACDALGGFLDDVREAGLADRTIVAATGDHNTRSFFTYPGTADLALQFGVPLLLAVPPRYLPGPPPDVTRWGSHRDVFPTLARLALSRARVFRSGDDLLAAPRRSPRALTRYEVVLADTGAMPRLGSGVFLRWEGSALAPCADDACRRSLEALDREERAYVGLLDWNVRRQALRPDTGD